MVKLKAAVCCINSFSCSAEGAAAASALLSCVLPLAATFRTAASEPQTSLQLKLGKTISTVLSLIKSQNQPMYYP